MVLLARRERYAVPLVTLVLAVPLLLGIVGGYQLLPTLLLAPFIAAIILMTLTDRTTQALIVCGVAGAASVLVVSLVMPGNVGLGLGLRAGVVGVFYETLFAASFVILGRQVPLRPTILWLAIWSSVFLICATAPLLVFGEPVRAISPTDGTASVNVSFFGLPVFGTYGINSLAPLFAIQAAICCGAMFVAPTRVKPLVAVGLACAVFLAIGTESRTTALSLLVIPIWLAFYAWRDRTGRRTSLAAVLAMGSAVALVGARGLDESRLAGTAEDVITLATEKPSEQTDTPPAGEPAPKPKPAELKPAPKPKPPPKTAENISTGRTVIWRTAILEWMQSPLFGNGFVGFGRWATEPLGKDLAQNVTAHNFFINPLWKGGLLFFLPYMAFAGLAARRAWATRDRSPEWVFGAVSVLVLFVSALTWDIATIPSAGAVGWFILGALGRERDVENAPL